MASLKPDGQGLLGGSTPSSVDDHQLTLTELRQRTLKRTLDKLHDEASWIVSLASQCKDLDSQLDVVRVVAADERLKKVSLSEESVGERAREFEVREKELKGFEERVTQRFREVELREKNGFQETERNKEWVEKWKRELLSFWETTSRKFKEGQEREATLKEMNERIKERTSYVKEMSERIKERASYVKVVMERVDDKRKEIEAKERAFGMCNKDLELKRKELEEWEERLRVKGKEVEEKASALRAKEREFKCKEQEEFKEPKFKVETFENRLNEREEELRVKEEEFDRKANALRAKETKLECRERELDLAMEYFQKVTEELEAKMKEAEDELRDRTFTEQSTMLEEKQIEESFLEIHSEDTKPVEEIEESELKESRVGKIPGVLLLASDPAKLVLHEITNDFPFEQMEDRNKPRKDYVLLLQQLRKSKPTIFPQLKEEALDIAKQWRRKLKGLSRSCSQTICFLHFVAAYELGPSFHAFDLLSLLNADHWRNEAADLCQALGIESEVPKFIRYLVTRDKRLLAIKFVIAFDKADEFPPATLLDNHLRSQSQNDASKSSLSNGSSGGKKIEDIKKEIKELKDVTDLFKKYKIKFSPEIINKQISMLEKQRVEAIHTFQGLTTKIGPCTSTSDTNRKEGCKRKLDVATATDIPLSDTCRMEECKRKLNVATPTDNPDSNFSAICAASSPAKPQTQPEEHTANKRHRVEGASSKGTPTTSVIPKPVHPPTEFLPGSRCMRAPARKYSLAGYPPTSTCGNHGHQGQFSFQRSYRYT